MIKVSFFVHTTPNHDAVRSSISNHRFVTYGYADKKPPRVQHYGAIELPIQAYSASFRLSSVSYKLAGEHAPGRGPFLGREKDSNLSLTTGRNGGRIEHEGKTEHRRPKSDSRNAWIAPDSLRGAYNAVSARGARLTRSDECRGLSLPGKYGNG